MQQFNDFLDKTLLTIQIPHSVIKYLKTSYQNDPYRILIELLLFCFMIWYVLMKKKTIGSNAVVLTEKEIDELCNEWVPEPLVPQLSEFQKQQLLKVPITTGQNGLHVKLIDGKDKLNFATFDFLGLLNREDIKTAAIEALKKYGVGTCGPRGFYGTIDVHLELEEKLAKFVGTESAIIYSQNYSTVSSAIPAFAKRGDVIVADEGSSLSLQVGQQISRSNVFYFKHNDMKDLERILIELQKSDLKKSKPLFRKFIVVEGIYLNHGDIAPLPELVALKTKYKYRLIVDESLSFGVLGKSGKGLSDHFDIPVSKIDIMIGSLTNSLGASGGFVCGDNEVCEHQRLSGQAYTFSASLPALLTVSAITALKIMENEPQLLTRLNENITLFWNCLTKGMNSAIFSGGVTQAGLVPLIFLRIKGVFRERDDEERVLQDIVDLALGSGVLISRAKFCIGQERNIPSPSIRILVSGGFTKKEIEKSALVLKGVIQSVVKSKKF